MIVRKPYAFFIKHFRLFHIIFLFLAFLIIVGNITLFEFFDDYVTSNQTTVSTYIVEGARINVLWPILLIAGLSIVMGVLIYKKKSIKLYIIEIATYVLLTILFIVSNNIMNSLTEHLVDIRLVKAVHDILLVTCFVEAIMMAMLFTRATGFDIKKFDFEKDYARLQLSEADREEVELNLEFDGNVLKTKVNKILRHVKYFYFENKTLCYIIIASFVLLVTGSIITYVKTNTHIIVRNNNINASKFVIKYENAYIDNRNIRGNLINGNNFIVVKTNIRVKGTNALSFNIANILLYIGQKSYTPNKSNNQYFTDFGNGYDDSKIEGEKNFYFVYEIPSDVELKNLKLIYSDNNKYYEKKLDCIDLRNDKFMGSYTINESAKLQTKFIGDLDFKIDEVSIENKFLVPYIYKVNNKYYTSSYYVSSSINGNYDKSVIRFVSNDCNLIANYGTIYYDNRKSSVVLNKIQPLKNEEYCYFETDRDVVGASEIYLNLSLRGNVYKYYLK